MNRRKTDGEKISDKWINADPEGLAADIDRIIRRRQKEAWEAGYNFRDVIEELEKEDAS